MKPTIAQWIRLAGLDSIRTLGTRLAALGVRYLDEEETDHG